MTKKVIVTINLVHEAENESNEVIETQIMKAISANSIPFFDKIEKVEIEGFEADVVKKLKEHGLSKTAVGNIIMFYHDQNACVK